MPLGRCRVTAWPCARTPHHARTVQDAPYDAGRVLGQPTAPQPAQGLTHHFAVGRDGDAHGGGAGVAVGAAESGAHKGHQLGQVEAVLAAAHVEARQKSLQQLQAHEEGAPDGGLAQGAQQGREERAKVGIGAGRHLQQGLLDGVLRVEVEGLGRRG